MADEVFVVIKETEVVGVAVNEGPAGETGADGLSAYQLAVAEGFVGTLAEWLESLQGEDGDDASVPVASPTTTGSVKVDSVEADPLVYTKATTDTLLAAKATAASVTAEAAARAAADTTLQGNLDAVEAASIAADASLDGRLDAVEAALPDLASAAEVDAAVDAAIAALIDAAPGALNTLNEIAAALGDDPNFAATVLAALDEKLTEAQADLLYAAIGHVHAFADLTDPPTTLAGYGITDAATDAELAAGLAGKSDTGHTHPEIAAEEAARIAGDAALDTRLDELEEGGAGTTWHLVIGTPPDALGDDGDLALDKASGDYYERVAGAYELRGNLTGPAGEQGETGATGAPGQDGIASGTYLLSGATLAWVSGFTYRVGAATYYLDGTLTTSAEQNVTLSAGDATFDRFDVIVLDAAGALDVIEGTPAASPAEPTVDPSLYLRLSTVLVSAAAVAADVTEETIWKEDDAGEWDATPSGGSIVIASTNQPRSGTDSIEGTTVAAGTSVTFERDSGSVDLASQDKLVFYIRPKAAWANKKAMRLTWLAAGVPVGSAVTVGNGLFGFNSQSTGAYQQIVVPLGAFSVPAGTAVDGLRLEIVGAGSSVGFYLDDLILQAGISTVAASQFRWRGTWDAGAAYAQNDAVSRNDATYLALQSNQNQDPVSATAYWVKLGITVAGAAALDDLTDVDTTGASTGDVLTFDGSAWGPAEPAAGEGTSPAIGFRLRKSTDTTIADASHTQVSFDTEDWDSNGFHEGVTNPTRVTIPAGLGGRYLIFAGIRTDAGTAFNLSIKVNGTDFHFEQRGNSTFVTTAGLLELADGDYIELNVFNASGGTRNIVASDGPVLAGYRLGSGTGALPAGGLTQQVLIKQSDDDFDAAWGDAATQAAIDAVEDAAIAADAALDARLDAVELLVPAVDVTDGEYGDATHVAQVTVADGVITGITEIEIADVAAGTKIGWMLRKSTDITPISASSHTVPNFDTEDWDSSGFHEGVTNPSRVTIPTGLGGVYLVHAFVEMDSGSGYNLAIKRNGTTWEYEQFGSPSKTISTGGLMRLADGDYIELNLFNGSGGTRTMKARAWSPVLSGYRVGD